MYTLHVVHVVLDLEQRSLHCCGLGPTKSNIDINCHGCEMTLFEFGQSRDVKSTQLASRLLGFHIRKSTSSLDEAALQLLLTERCQCAEISDADGLM